MSWRARLALQRMESCQGKCSVHIILSIDHRCFQKDRPSSSERVDRVTVLIRVGEQYLTKNGYILPTSSKAESSAHAYDIRIVSCLVRVSYEPSLQVTFFLYPGPVSLRAVIKPFCVLKQPLRMPAAPSTHWSVSPSTVGMYPSDGKVADGPWFLRFTTRLSRSCQG